MLRVTFDNSLPLSRMESVPCLVLCPWRAPSPTQHQYIYCLTAACSCIYIDFCTLLQELSSPSSGHISSFPNLMLSSLLALSSLSPFYHSSAIVLSCHFYCSSALSSSPHPLPPLLKNLTWGQASGGGGDLQRRRIAAAALACVHAVQALGSGAESGSSSNSNSLLSELSCLVQVSSYR
jgi:hypothetical protein